MNLLKAWIKFSKGKKSNLDVSLFELYLEENLFNLNDLLLRGKWKNDRYFRKNISDPKPRIIHVASVRDRVLYQAVYQSLYQIFDKIFIYDSYASRNFKGIHAGVKRLEKFIRKASKNYSQNAWVLKCDIRKFFDSVDHKILSNLILRKIEDKRLAGLIRTIIESFNTISGKGLPLGNVTSQLFANIYLNELDQFVKHVLKARYYIRYCDDFLILDSDKSVLEKYVSFISSFLENKLKLKLHPNKISLRKIGQGIDFLGYVNLPHRIVLRTKTKRRMLKKICEKNKPSYFGLLNHCKGRIVRRKVEDILQQDNKLAFRS